MSQAADLCTEKTTSPGASLLQLEDRHLLALAPPGAAQMLLPAQQCSLSLKFSCVMLM